jgi:hypothetical protein
MGRPFYMRLSACAPRIDFRWMQMQFRRLIRKPMD